MIKVQIVSIQLFWNQEYWFCVSDLTFIVIEKISTK